eukprot:CAMPEP_0196656708 /NCGR_PEP_ID=MMETSP1086-20130531/19395_1 /TAXON_ID=77921 /ORGANISM="Cyanoptyche  gloeocystis , Strain SAG4.97" /LENGTH=256 /DNA_ID=CAMNT_0041989559 /DNA_START=56 /DNA_END=823 /DNA_ORIENTATION=+
MACFSLSHNEKTLQGVKVDLPAEKIEKAGCLYIARHGERVDYINAVWNDDADCPYDPPLSDDGHRHADELGRRVARSVYRDGDKGKIHKIFVSPFWRTLQTAAQANKWIRAPMEVAPELSEHLSGRYFHETPVIESNSLPKDVLQHGFQGLVSHGPVVLPPFPEDHDAMLKRAGRAVKQLSTHCVNHGHNIMLVSHAALCTAMIREMVGDAEFSQKVKKAGDVGYCASVKLSLSPVDKKWHVEWYHRGEKTRHALR